jgi:tetratricopeptide (TPR) repeat protein
VQNFGGRIEELGSAGLVAAFGLEPLEDAPGHAVHAGIAILKAAERAHPEKTRRAGVKIGVHVGQVLLGRAGGTVQIDRDAREREWAVLRTLVDSAQLDTVVVSETAGPFLERRFGLLVVGPDKRASGHMYRLDQRARSRLGVGGDTGPFEGRRRELEMLKQCYERARGGTIQVVHVVGEPGIGKSRLVQECRQQFEHEGALIFQGHCAAFGRSTPFLPFVEVVRAAFLTGEDEEPQAITGKLRRGLELLGLPAEASLPFLQVLLGLEVEGPALRGLDPQTVGIRTREVLHQILQARCRLSPVVLILEDLHWSDSASQDLLQRVAEGRESLPLLVIGTHRPPYRPPGLGRPEVTELHLEPLSDESCLRLVEHRLRAEVLPGELARLILDRAEGNPLFAEELARYLEANRHVVRAGRTVSFRASPAATSLPATLQHLVVTQADQLPTDARTLIDLAAVAGRHVPLDLLGMASRVDGDLAHHLHALEAQGLLVRREPDGRGEEYCFKHVLFQEAVYGALPAARREALHERVAEGIERLYRDRLGEWADVLAYHYSQTPRADKAVRYLALAGEKNLRIYSLEEADQRFRQAVNLIESLPGSADDTVLADVLLGWVQVYFYRSNFKGLITLVERYRARVEGSGDARRLARLLFWLGWSHIHAARCEVAKPLLEQALALGEAAGDDESTGYASMGLMLAYWVAPGDQPGDLVDRFGERALAIAERLDDVLLTSLCLNGLALHKTTSSEYHEARRFSLRLLELGRAASSPRVLALGLCNLGLVNVYDERYEEALENAEEAFRIGPSPLHRLIALATKGMALVFMGRAQEGLEVLSAVRRDLVAGGYLVQLGRVDFAYGVALARTGQPAEGIRWIEDAIRRFSTWGNNTLPAFGHMFLGELYLRIVAGDAEVPLRTVFTRPELFLRTRLSAARTARRHLEEAIRSARELGMPGVLARSLLDMGLLCRARGRFEDARRHFEEARRVAEPPDWPVLSMKIRQAIDALPQPQRVA